MKKIFVTYAVKEEYFPLQIEGYDIQHIRTGVGKTLSAFRLTRAICRETPDLVLNIGTAGTFEHQVGDIFIAKRFIDRDYEATKLPGLEYEIDANALLPDDRSLKDWVQQYDKLGICSTGDTFVTELSSFGADMVDMEAYAQAFVCRELNVPFISVKYITDIIGQNSVQHWEDKLADARLGLAEWFNRYV
ncbi:5'-methylthioadenosine/S-adenosylhomocysteine nucleosidase [Bacteroides sp. 51]|uniref:5'-methylthioadenosine/S-adenosylhomocysteine nucleosidase family protein n=1 Tax=Bacteroides sp. 51 TaxID=2302938 RepID=UPI0013D1DD98|nr:5'-methylthioadenosine/S-adenosylhomocysteine nucleosidase [Bacteroides sp. 51]NDV83212.1 nucleosidase [Bacteroides sp. 51]